MRVAVAHGDLGPWDGSSRYIADVAALFAEHGHEVSLICRGCTRELSSGLVPRHPEELAADERFDLLYGSDLELLAVLQPRAERFFYAPLDVLASSPERERWALQQCDRIFRFTSASVDILERTYGMELHAKSVISVYVSRAFEDLAEPHWSRPTPPELLWVGRLIDTKNVAFLIRAVALLQSPSWRLVLVGDGPERPALEKQVEDGGLAERVQFVGHALESSPYFKSASLFLTASTSEHYSLTLMEAAAHGVPCIGLAPDGSEVFNACDEQILDGFSGFLVSDEEQMARCIDRLLNDESAREAMARRTWQRKMDEFTAAHFWGELQSAFSKVLRGAAES